MGKESYDRGFLDALYAYAWMKDGVYYVGSGLNTLKRAQEKIEDTLNYQGHEEE